MEKILNRLFDKHSEGYGVYDRENLIKDICKELQNPQSSCKHDFISSVAYKGAKICTKCNKYQ